MECDKIEKGIVAGFEVPVEVDVERFGQHLVANDRTILSAKFGDGKSYFLDKVKSDAALLDKFAFLTIYPVNYQVMRNEDVFDLLKRDLLFQMMIHGMVKDDLDLHWSSNMALFLYRKSPGLFMDMVCSLDKVGLSGENYTKAFMAMTGIRCLRELWEKFDEYRNEEAALDGDRICAFLDKMDAKSILEEDVITHLIRKALEDYREEQHKQVVLIIEDLDRMDPAHLFRILNVFSAHMDYCYKSGVKPDRTLVGNKFGLDKIVLSVDYDNLGRVFHHFYGADTDEEGYFSKFLSSRCFNYSLEKVREDYIYKGLQQVTGLPEELVKTIFDKETLSGKSMRNVVQAMDINKELVKSPETYFLTKPIPLDASLLKAIAVLRRLGFSDVEINNTLMGIWRRDYALLFPYIGPYLFMDTGTIYGVVSMGDGSYDLSMKLDEKTGHVQLLSRVTPGSNDCFSMSDAIRNMLDLVAR